MIFDDIADLITIQMQSGQSAERLANIFQVERKTIYNYRNGCCFRLTYDFICGLNRLGYDLALVKKGHNTHE